MIDSRDVTERQHLEAALEHQAFHDTLTDLANRALFQDRSRHAFERSHSNQECHAIVLLDLDNFKAINDGLGHAAGDQLLVQVADRLRACCRDGDTVSRLGGDEFALLLEDIDSPEEAGHAATRILTGLRDPFVIEGRQATVTASVGVAVKDDSDDVNIVLRNADIAMYLAKRRGKGRIETFQPSSPRSASDWRSTTSEPAIPH